MGYYYVLNLLSLFIGLLGDPVLNIYLVFCLALAYFLQVILQKCATMQLEQMSNPLL